MSCFKMLVNSYVFFRPVGKIGTRTRRSGKDRSELRMEFKVKTCDVGVHGSEQRSEQRGGSEQCSMVAHPRKMFRGLQTLRQLRAKRTSHCLHCYVYFSKVYSTLSPPYPC
jgi:hypothetical protein